jgi:hypothetical protein
MRYELTDYEWARFGLVRVSLPGGYILVPSTSGAVGDQIRVRILATVRQPGARAARPKFDP